MNDKYAWYRVSLLTIILICALCGFATLSSASSADGKLYYIQIGLFKIETNAWDLKQKISAHTPRVIVHGLKSAKLGRIYKVLMGPYATRQEAYEVRLTMIEQGALSKDAFIITASEPFPGSLPTAVETTEQPVVKAPVPLPPEPTVTAPAEPTPDKEAPPLKQAGEAQPESPAPPPVAPAVTASPTEPAPDDGAVSREPEAPAVPPAPEVETQYDIDLKETKELQSRQRNKKGRNLGKSGFGLAFRHCYGEYQNKIDSRQSRVNGVTETIPLSTIQNLNFNTTMHRDMLRLRYGVLDRLELFVDFGMAYGDSVSPKFVYGGGGRFEFYRPLENESHNLFFALQAGFLTGELETEFTSTQNAQWNKVSDWYEATLCMEAGMRFARWAPYLGLSYSVYREDTERTPDSPIASVPASTTYMDELSEDTPISVYGGVDIDLTKKWRLTFEGRLGTFNGLSGSIQYNFK